jgi:hypothetical protein
MLLRAGAAVAALTLAGGRRPAPTREDPLGIPSAPVPIIASSGMAMMKEPPPPSFWTTTALRTFTHVPCPENAYPTRDGRSVVIDGRHRLSASAASAGGHGAPGGGSPYASSWDGVLAEAATYRAAARGWLLRSDAWPLDGSFGVEKMRAVLEAPSSVGGTDGQQPLAPFVQRVLVPPNATVATFGDLHGSVHSFLRELRSLMASGHLDEDLRVTPPHRQSFFLLFLGDYVDRGSNGLEVLLTLLRLKRTNPHNVFMARGNHEDLEMNTGSEDFLEEVARKFPDAVRTADDLGPLAAIYDTLPSAIFLGVRGQGREKGTAWRTAADDAGAATVDDDDDEGEGGRPPARHLLCCHGGIEVGFETLPLLHAPAGPAPGAANASEAGAPSYPFPPRLLPSSAVSQYALLHGFFRGDWVDALPKDVYASIPARTRSLFTNLGARPHLDLEGSKTSTSSRSGAEGGEQEEEATTASSGVDALAASIRNDAWGGPEWPKSPTHTHTHNGFMWNDFFVDDGGESIYFRPGRGLAFGRSLTRHYLRASGVVGVFRAHQHNDAAPTGPMLQRIKSNDPPGVFDNWERSGFVLTFLSGAWVPGLNHAHDTYSLAHFPSDDPATWWVEGCAQRVGGQHVRAGEGDGGSWVEGTTPNDPAYAEAIVVQHACNMDTASFVCKDIGWRASSEVVGGKGGVGGGGEQEL